MKAVLSLVFLLWLGQANAEEQFSMKQYVPALEAMVASNLVVKESDPLRLQQDEMFLAGIVQGAFSSIVLANLLDPGSYKEPKKDDLLEALKVVLKRTANRADLLHISPGDFIVGTLFQEYATDATKQRSPRH